MQQLTIDSIVVSSTVIHAPIQRPAAAPRVETNLPARRSVEFAPERVARMYARHLPVPTNFWDGVAAISYCAFIDSYLIKLTQSLQKEYPTTPAFRAWRNLPENHVKVSYTMIQLYRIVVLAKHLRILQ